MSIITIETKITYTYLMNKTKSDLVQWLLREIDENERLADSLRVRMKSIPEGITLAKYVENRILEIFVDVADTMANITEPDETPELAPGIPMQLFRAQETLLSAWRGYLSKLETDSNHEDHPREA